MKARIDENNFFLNAYNDNYNFPPEWILIDITDEELQLICELVKCRKEGNNWVQVPNTPEEIAQINNQKVIDSKIWLYEKYENLLTSSLARAVGKENEGLTRDQLFSLREEYGDIKKLSEAYLADGTILNAKLFQDITDEMNLDFPIPFLDQTIAYLNSVYASNPVYQIIPTDENTTQITKFCWLVVNKYNLGESVWQYLKDLFSKFRKRMITNLDLFEFEKFEQRKLLVNSITNETTIEDIQDLETQFDAI